ncbi:ABC transporter permease [Leifsonia soli]|uniref:Peptide/nickel transport system permease protein n=1 Tax=Leifsonia soli TaxID=582665 RepID=A0A852T319_9MICO|nr:ABC transporter permease [Leifsonia soli]NYD75054.1 peptide/nickel transport system permease protein [Leifsonia soli]
MTALGTPPASTAPAAAVRPTLAARLGRTPWGLVAAVAFAVLLLVAVIAPQALTTHLPTAIDYQAALQPPSLVHPFGTDESGRDLYTRVVWGARDSLTIGLGAAAVGVGLALVLGTLAALGVNPVAVVIDRFVEILFAFPALLLALLLIAIAGPSAATQVFAVGIGTAPGYARMIRGQILGARESGYVEAATALGHSRWRILRAHILPNALRPLVAVFALSIGQSIVWASSLSFLGLGVAPPASEWGALLDAGRQYLTTAWWLVVIPGLVIVAVALAATTIGRHIQARLEKGERS